MLTSVHANSHICFVKHFPHTYFLIPWLKLASGNEDLSLLRYDTVYPWITLKMEATSSSDMLTYTSIHGVIAKKTEIFNENIKFPTVSGPATLVTHLIYLLRRNNFTVDIKIHLGVLLYVFLTQKKSVYNYCKFRQIFHGNY
jgi:hypothetical protein